MHEKQHACGYRRNNCIKVHSARGELLSEHGMAITGEGVCVWVGVCARVCVCVRDAHCLSTYVLPPTQSSYIYLSLCRAVVARTMALGSPQTGMAALASP